jgi:RluA family pseudouridine synthase
MKEWEVSGQENGDSLLAFLKGKLQGDYSAGRLKREINAGQCRLNQKVERFASRLVGKGDRVSFYTKSATDLQTPGACTKSATDLEDPGRILFADEDLIAYNKPPGIASDAKKLLKIIEGQFKGAVLLHRLDRDTTGVLLFARNAFAEEEMLKQFRKRLVQKTYWALVDGVPRTKSGCIENFLGKLHVYNGQAIWGEVAKDACPRGAKKGVYAKTSWEISKVSKTGGKAALLVCHPETGRTHQIRVHLAGMGHPILGDAQYGKSAQYALRLMLHAAGLAFTHPRLNSKISIAAPAPQDFQDAVSQAMK